MDDRPSTSDASNGASRPERQPSRRGGLGRGLGALIPTGSPVASQSVSSATELPIDAIEPNPFQPRASMDPDKLQLLADSIRQHGIIQPLVVKASSRPNHFILIAGERRWRASKLAGLTVVPAVVKDAAPQAMLEMALVENVVRADLSPLEEAQAYRQLIEEFNLTQANVAERVGRSRVSVTNTLRLLAAPEQIQQALSAGRISEGHARALLGLSSSADQVAMLDVVIIARPDRPPDRGRGSQMARQCWNEEVRARARSGRGPARGPFPHCPGHKGSVQAQSERRRRRPDD